MKLLVVQEMLATNFVSLLTDCLNRVTRHIHTIKYSKYSISLNKKPDELWAWVDFRRNIFEGQFAKLHILHFTLVYRAYLREWNICGSSGTVWVPLLLNKLSKYILKPYSFALDMSLWKTNSAKWFYLTQTCITARGECLQWRKNWQRPYLIKKLRIISRVSSLRSIPRFEEVIGQQLIFVTIILAIHR